MRILVQPGIGDTLFAYPIIKELSRNNVIMVGCGAPDLLRGLNVAAVSSDGFRTPDIHLRFEAYRGKSAYEQMSACAKIHPPEFDYSSLSVPVSSIVTKIENQALRKGKKILVVHEPHTAFRHRKSGDPRDAANIEEMNEWLEPYAGSHEIVTVGKDDIFHGRIRADVRTENALTLWDLLFLIKAADIVATQSGICVVPACMYRKKLKLFKSRGDSDKSYEIRKKIVVIPNTAEMLP